MILKIDVDNKIIYLHTQTNVGELRKKLEKFGVLDFDEYTLVPESSSSYGTVYPSIGISGTPYLTTPCSPITAPAGANAIITCETAGTPAVQFSNTTAIQ